MKYSRIASLSLISANSSNAFVAEKDEEINEMRMKTNKLKLMSMLAFCFINFSFKDAQCMEDSDQINLMAEYKVSKNFVSLRDCPKLCEAADKMISKFYTQENIEKRIASIAAREGDVDSLKGREGYAFMIHHSSMESDNRLPGVSFNDLDPIIQNACKLLESKLEIKKGRYLLNFQRYYQDSALLPLHQDREPFSLVKHEKLVTVEEAIVPNKVAVLTLINNAIGGGTRISTKDRSNSTVIECAPSDLLVFNNNNILHGADVFKENPDFHPPYVRYTMGCRSFEYDCKYFNITNEDKIKDVTYEEVVEMHCNFTENDWPRMLRYSNSSSIVPIEEYKPGILREFKVDEKVF